VPLVGQQDGLVPIIYDVARFAFRPPLAQVAGLEDGIIRTIRLP
jgi:hypothetical protein